MSPPYVDMEFKTKLNKLLEEEMVWIKADRLIKALNESQELKDVSNAFHDFMFSDVWVDKKHLERGLEYLFKLIDGCEKYQLRVNDYKRTDMVKLNVDISNGHEQVGLSLTRFFF